MIVSQKAGVLVAKVVQSGSKMDGIDGCCHGA